MQGTAADDASIEVSDEELLHVLVQGHRGLRQKAAVVRVRVDEATDRAHVGGPRTADDGLFWE
jgi:hypothetical protein